MKRCYLSWRHGERAWYYVGLENVGVHVGVFLSWRAAANAAEKAGYVRPGKPTDKRFSPGSVSAAGEHPVRGRQW